MCWVLCQLPHHTDSLDPHNYKNYKAVIPVTTTKRGLRLRFRKSHTATSNWEGNQMEGRGSTGHWPGAAVLSHAQDPHASLPDRGLSLQGLAPPHLFYG